MDVLDIFVNSLFKISARTKCIVRYYITDYNENQTFFRLQYSYKGEDIARSSKYIGIRTQEKDQLRYLVN